MTARQVIRQRIVHDSEHETGSSDTWFIQRSLTDWVRTPGSMDPLPPEPSKPSSSTLPEEDWLSRRADIRQDELGSVNSRSAEIDWSRLAAQWLSLIVLCAGGFVVTRESRAGSPRVGSDCPLSATLLLTGNGAR